MTRKLHIVQSRDASATTTRNTDSLERWSQNKWVARVCWTVVSLVAAEFVWLYSKIDFVNPLSKVPSWALLGWIAWLGIAWRLWGAAGLAVVLLIGTGSISAFIG